MVLIMKSVKISLFVVVLLSTIASPAVGQLSRLQFADKQFELANYRIAAEEYSKQFSNQPNYAVAQKTAVSWDRIYEFSEAYSWWKKAVGFPEATKEDYGSLVRAGFRSIKDYKASADLVGSPYSAADFPEFTSAATGSLVSFRSLELKGLDDLNSSSSDYSLSIDDSGSRFFSSNKGDGGLKSKSGIRFDAKGSGLSKGFFHSDGSQYYQLYVKEAEKGVRKIQILGYELFHLSDPNLASNGTLFFTATPNRLSKKDQVIYPGVFYGTYNPETASVTNVKVFPFNQTNSFGVLATSLDEEQKKLYFSSNKPGGMGGYDIYSVTWDSQMNFSEPVNLGSSINSPSNERDGYRFGNEFYYSSDKKGGIGGLDIYLSTVQGNTFGPSKNIGKPINSVADDFGFSRISGKEGYFSSDRLEGKGSDDLYGLSWANKKLKINLTNPAGILVNPGASLQLQTESGRLVELSGKSETEIGDFLESGKSYSLSAKLPGYFPQDITFTFSENVDELKIGLVQIPYGLELLKAIIYYDLDKDFLRELSKEKLTEVAEYLNRHPELVLQIESHTDSRASDEYNQKLSERRAKSVIAFLENKGIAANRIQSNWFSEAKLVNPCGDNVPCSEDDHQLNRRTELKLIAFPVSSKSYSLPKGAKLEDFKSKDEATKWFLKK
jgi:outer membrane protein OmpA-like peptidoglycan-associated protein